LPADGVDSHAVLGAPSMDGAEMAVKTAILLKFKKRAEN
jgi:hypothetical protein